MPNTAHEPLKFVSRPADEADDQVELFSLDGKPYLVSSRPRANLALQVIDDMVHHGPAIAEIIMLRKAIGDEAFDALKNFDGLTPEDIQGLGRAVTRLTLGALEDDPAGNSSGASE